MRTVIYQALVNRQPGIRERYHRVHDGTAGIARLLSWGYLLWLNLCYYLFFCRFLGRPMKVQIYEERRLPVGRSESEGSRLQYYTEALAEYDVISFDIFDTLIFRPFSAPTDLFFLLGEELDFLDFKRIRVEAEQKARREEFERSGSFEVTLEQIWRIMGRESGLDADVGIELETELEKQLCYANPLMLEVYRDLTRMGKNVVAVSDMYLPRNFLIRLLEQNGYVGLREIYVSNEIGKSKWNGELFEEVGSKLRHTYGDNIRIVHVGDNPRSDVKTARKHGFVPVHYPNADSLGALYRPQDMSPLIGGAYRGIVNHHLHGGAEGHSPEYEFGYLYGGLFVLGYCAFIREYAVKSGIDRLLFLSRDGDILKQAYDLLYPGGDTRYVYWSRAAALKLTADENRYDFFRRFLYHKVNQGKRISQILDEMELDGVKESFGLDGGEILTSENVARVRDSLLAHWAEVLDIYRPQGEAAKKYYEQMLDGAGKVAAVDIGWAGSGAMALRTLAERVWALPCEIVGILAGTNSIYNAEPEAAEPQLKSGKLVSYLFSSEHNRDLFKKHDPGRDDNVYWELLLSSPTRQFLGFYPSEGSFGNKLNIRLRFGSMPGNPSGCQEIQRGILDFVKDYQKHFAAYPYMFSISGRDAYAPMLVAMSHNRRYLKAFAARFQTDISVVCGGETVCRNI